ncbi:MAG: PAS domain S-box protein [Candidatus Cloacimonetes bacterium]|jgi:PAS domain S-box-containing protein|nr:PAS domain S-box protein [Candidatus Cloacimonadota bacterium]MBT4334188.1 PAS domain S-box protein [Candidatus Cloacimonadota bacterium]MBT4575072.1 PAS domain S-box protein [Candidatus Cloacimonadota bacterium]MBT5421141.1 PAS domain S-box protein [Candidatus Cloacimonadota bacterium]
MKNFEKTKEQLLIENKELKVKVAELEQSETERKQAELSLKNTEEKYNVLTDNMNVGLVLHGADTKILFSNPAASRILGLTIEQMKGKEAIDPAWSFVKEDGSPMPLEEYPVNITIKTKKQFQDYILGINIPGNDDLTWVLVNANPILDENGTITYISITFSNITDRKIAEEELSKHREHLEELIEERTKELQKTNKDLDSALKVFVGRELTISKLEKRIRALEGKE